MQEEPTFICLYPPQTSSIVSFPPFLPLQKKTSICAIMPKSWHIKSWSALGENQFSVRSCRHLAFLVDAFSVSVKFARWWQTMAARFSGLLCSFTLVFAFRVSSCHFPCKNRIARPRSGTPLNFALCCTDTPLKRAYGFVIVVIPVECYFKIHSHYCYTILTRRGAV